MPMFLKPLYQLLRHSRKLGWRRGARKLGTRGKWDVQTSVIVILPPFVRTPDEHERVAEIGTARFYSAQNRHRAGSRSSRERSELLLHSVFFIFVISLKKHSKEFVVSDSWETLNPYPNFKLLTSSVADAVVICVLKRSHYTALAGLNLVCTKSWLQTVAVNLPWPPEYMAWVPTPHT